MPRCCLKLEFDISGVLRRGSAQEARRCDKAPWQPRSATGLVHGPGRMGGQAAGGRGSAQPPARQGRRALITSAFPLRVPGAISLPPLSMQTHPLKGPNTMAECRGRQWRRQTHLLHGTMRDSL